MLIAREIATASRVGVEVCEYVRVNNVKNSVIFN